MQLQDTQEESCRQEARQQTPKVGEFEIKAEMN